MKNKANLPILLMMFFCIVFVLILLGLESHHNMIKEQVSANEQLITTINDENSELQQIITELEPTYEVKLLELARWQRQHQIIKDLIQ